LTVKKINMATSSKSKYSTYAGLDTAPPVNWGSVANTISKQIGAFTEKRKLDQQAVEDATQSAIEKLNELPDVNSQDLDTALLDSAKSQQEQLMMNMGLVRKGVIKMHDYKMRMNSMKNGYTNFKNITKVYDGWYTAAKDRVKNKTATEADIAFMERIESFGNLQNKKFMTNPANGQLQVVTMGYNEKTKKYDIMPDPGKEPNSFQNPGVILDMMKYDGGIKVDLDAATSEVTDKLGVIIRSSINPDTGEKYTMEDFRQIFKSPERIKAMGISENITTFDQWLDSQADALTGDDAAMAQILATQAGYQYTDPKAPNYIELKGTGNSVVFGKDGKGLSEANRKKARDIVKNMISQKIDSKQDAQKGFNPDSQKNREDNIKKGGNIIENLDAVYSGDQAQVDGALDALYASSGFRYDSFEDKGDYFDVVYFDGDERKQQRLSKGKNKEDFLNTGYAFFQTDKSGAEYKDARDKANVSDRNQSDYAMNDLGKKKEFKTNAAGEFVDKDGNPTTRRSQFVEAERSEKVDKNNNPLPWDGTYKNEIDGNEFTSKEYKINKKRSTPTQQKREAREGITSDSTIGTGKDAVAVNSYYKDTVDDIGKNSNFWGGSGDGNDKQMENLEGGIRTAINKAGEARGVSDASKNITFSKSGKIITLTVNGEKITIKSTNDGTLMSKVNKAVDKALRIVLPAQESGYGNGKYD
tara:strand:+ start:788 stop:2884 length:2097 start_codon:yes stop_codon:yes gene_type:complete